MREGWAIRRKSVAVLQLISDSLPVGARAPRGGRPVKIKDSNVVMAGHRAPTPRGTQLRMVPPGRLPKANLTDQPKNPHGELPPASNLAATPF
jgi:hypothetical protein